MPNSTTICVLGGSFDPVHIGHVVLAARAREALGVDTVTLMPTARSPQKGHANADDAARLEMLRAVAAGLPWMRVSELEIRRGAPSYTIDTVIALRKESPGATIVWVVGADQWASLHSWHRAQELASLCQFAVAKRPGAPKLDLSNLFKLLGVDATSRLIAASIDMPQLDISSSDIRSRLANNLSVDGLVPNAALDVIRARGLYQSATSRA